MDERIDDLLKKAANKFLLVNAISARAKQVTEGSLPYIENFDPNNPIMTAIREIGAGKILIKALEPVPDGARPSFLSVRPRPKMDEAESVLERLEKGAKKKAAPAAKKK